MPSGRGPRSSPRSTRTPRRSDRGQRRSARGIPARVPRRLRGWTTLSKEHRVKHPRFRWAALAAAVATFGLASTAQAADPQIINTNSGRALEAHSDRRVTVSPSNAANLRQHWQIETGSNGQVRYRSSAFASCLVTPLGATSASVDRLTLGPCGGIGARNLWSPASFSTSGSLIQSAQSTQIISEALCIGGPCDDLAHVVPGSFAPLDFITR